VKDLGSTFHKCRPSGSHLPIQNYWTSQTSTKVHPLATSSSTDLLLVLGLDLVVLANLPTKVDKRCRD